MTSKLSFRARALDTTKYLPIYCEHEIPDNADSTFINRAVPQMPTGMEKEEETEHHLQLAICAGTVIPTPEVMEVEDVQYYDRLYPENYKMPRQLIYMQPFSMEADIPDYDMDSEDEQWMDSQSKLDLNPDKFEEMMDRLEKGSGQTVVTLQEAKALIKEDDDLIIAVYDYWLNKRLMTQHPLISQVKTEARFGASNHNPYIAFRRRTEKMQTRKNRKNDESSYEKMLKLKRDLTRAVTLLEMVKRREKSKRELLHLSIEVFEKRYQLNDFSGQLMAEALAQRPTRPIFSPLLQSSWLNNPIASMSKKEKRHYKKRRHKSASKSSVSAFPSNLLDQHQPFGSTDDQNRDASDEEEEEEGEYALRRNKNCSYHQVRDTGNFYWASHEEQLSSNKKFRFCPTSVTSSKPTNGLRYAGYCRRRMGRGGRVILDRMSYESRDDFWRSMGYNIEEAVKVEPESVDQINVKSSDDIEVAAESEPKSLHFRPKTPPESVEPGSPNEPSELDESESDEYQTLLRPFESKPRPRLFLGKYLTAVVEPEGNPLVYDVGTLRSDPEPHSICRPAYLTDSVEQPFCDTDLFNHELNFETELELDMLADPWFTPTDLQGTEDLTATKVKASNTSSSYPDRPDKPPSDSHPDPSGAKNSSQPGTPDPDSSNSNSKSAIEQTNSGEAASAAATTSEPMDISATGELNATSSESDRRRSSQPQQQQDKDDKENDRILLSTHTNATNGPTSVGPSDPETTTAAVVVVNGDTTVVDSSEECIKDEQKSTNFAVLPSKQWMCSAIALHNNV